MEGIFPDATGHPVALVMYIAQVGVPIIVTFLIKEWLKKGTLANVEIATQFAQVNHNFDQLQMRFASMNDKINRMELRLAEQGIDDLKANIELLKESRTEHRLRLDSIGREIKELQNEAARR